MSAETYYLVALDVERDKIALQRKLSRQAVASIFEREIDLEDQSHVLIYEPLALFIRRESLVPDEIRLVLRGFTSGLMHTTHPVILLLKGDPRLEPQELDQVKRALGEYYLSLR